MIKPFSKLQYLFRSVAFFGLAAQLLVAGSATAADVLDNNLMRFGSGSENSINSKGNLQQPFYYNSLNGWRKLTYSSRALNQSFALGGDGAVEWNLNGNRLDDPEMAGQVIDTSVFTPTDGGTKGYGTLVSTGTITIGSQNLEITNTYELLANKSYATITTKVKNTSGAPADNLRVWVGTGDDYVGGTDSPTKAKGNLVNGAFEQITDPAERALALRITSGDEGVLFFTNSSKANTILHPSYSWDSMENVINRNPADSEIILTSDGSYGFYVRMNDLDVGASDQFTWYYAAGDIANFDEIISDVAAASGAVSNIGPETATFKATTSADSTGYWIVVPRDAAAPSKEQIKARANYGSVTVAARGSAPMVDGVEASFSITGLQSETSYDLYFVAQDNASAFSSVVKAPFRTTVYLTPIDPVAPVTAQGIPTLSEWALMLLAGMMGLFGMAQVQQRKRV